MRIDFATLAFGYRVLAGGSTPNWATALGQGKEHKINDDPEINELLKGMTYSSVPSATISTKIGKGGKMYSGEAKDTPIVIGSVFSKVYINETLIPDGQFVLIITRDDSESHAGRLRLKYGPSNTYTYGSNSVSNALFFAKARETLHLADDACWFVSHIDIVNQNELVLSAAIINPTGSMEYGTTADLHKAWDEIGGYTQAEILSETEGDDVAKWFTEQAQSYNLIDEEASTLYNEFKEKFGPDALANKSGLELLRTMFINDTPEHTNMCYALEFDSRFKIFGGIQGSSAYKYGLYFNKQVGSWMTGSGKKPIKLSEVEAIELGSQIRDELVNGTKAIEEYGPINDLSDYASLYAKLLPIMPKTLNKVWVMKYLHMIFPALFPVFYNEWWQKRALEKANIEADENAFVRMGQIALFVRKCGISNVVFSKVIYSLGDDAVPVESQSVTPEMYSFDTTIVGGKNMVIYGTPGCGKSYYVDKILLPNILRVPEENIFRTTFYQDYTNTDFVGQILPMVQSDKSVTYEFNPGPFTLALKKAIEEPDEIVALVIEELNRGNAPSIFGDIFQLLDREHDGKQDGKSEYKIVNVNIQDYLNKCFEEQSIQFNCIRIPANLYIIATMNTSDQNVFTLDTAFKRRWLFEKMKNEFNATHKYKGFFVPGMDGVTWEQLVTGINEYILSRTDGFASEDKLVGVYFIEEGTLCEKREECNDEEKKKRFAYKLFEYLWDDVAKFAREDWFGNEVKSLDQLIDAYMADGKAVLKNVIKQIQ